MFEMNQEYQELEKLLIEYAEPFSQVERAVKEAESEKSRLEYENER